MTQAERHYVSRVLNRDHRELIGLVSAPNSRRGIIATIAAFRLAPSAFRAASIILTADLFKRLGVPSHRVKRFTVSRKTSRILATWPALAVELLVVGGEPSLRSPQRFEETLDLLDRAASHVVREADSRAAARRLGALKPGRPAPTIDEASVPERPVGWSTSAYFTGGE